MARFEPIDLAWGGVAFTVPADQVLKAIALIEDHVTFDELQAAANRGTIPLAKVSNAFAAVLRMVGAKVSADDVYAGMFTAGDTRDKTTLAIVALMSMMIPPLHLRQDLTGNPPAPAGGNGQASSKPRGKRPSPRSGSRR